MFRKEVRYWLQPFINVAHRLKDIEETKPVLKTTIQRMDLLRYCL